MRTRAWVQIGSREYLVGVRSLRAWLEHLDQELRGVSVSDPSPAFLGTELAASFLKALGGSLYGIRDQRTGEFLPGFDPDDPSNIVQSSAQMHQGLCQAAAMGEAGMRQVMYGFLLAAGAEGVRGFSQVVSQGRTVAGTAGGTAAPGSTSVWSRPPVARGLQIEEELAATEYAGWYRTGQRFPLVDFQKGDTLVSVKTVDTRGTGWYRRMTRHIDDLARRGITVGGRPARMELDLRVPPGGTEVAQPLRDYGKAAGVEVRISEYP